jgi:enoyl-CoA hydratase
MAYEHLLFEENEGIAVLTFNRPKSMNALNGALLKELSQVLDEIEANEEIRVLILTGAGEKAFVAGADITELAQYNPIMAKNFGKIGQGAINKLQALSIPVIAAVNGFALGGGNEIALACDFIYASETAMFGLPEINLGIIPGFGGTQRLPRQIGIARAKEMIFTGKLIPAAEAAAIGLVNKVFAPDQLMAEVLKTAKVIASKGKVSLRAAKEAVNQGLGVDLATGCKIEIDLFSLCMASEDSKEGTTAFLEKRKAAFKGGRNR